MFRSVVQEHRFPTLTQSQTFVYFVLHSSVLTYVFLTFVISVWTHARRLQRSFYSYMEFVSRRSFFLFISLKTSRQTNVKDTYSYVYIRQKCKFYLKEIIHRVYCEQCITGYVFGVDETERYLEILIGKLLTFFKS